MLTPESFKMLEQSQIEQLARSSCRRKSDQALAIQFYSLIQRPENAEALQHFVEVFNRYVSELQELYDMVIGDADE